MLNIRVNFLNTYDIITESAINSLKKYIEDFGSITTLEAFAELGIVRLGARISEMRKDGLNITDKQECVKNRYGEKCYIKRYFLESDN